MGFRLSFAFYGDEQVNRTLARFTDRVKDARPAWEAMAQSFERLMRRQFASEGAHASGGWSPLSPRYARWKAVHFPGAKILERSGNLKRTLTQRPFGVESIERQRMAIGSDDPVGRFHQRGDGVPQRRPVELTGHARTEWVRILQRHIISE